MALMFAWKSEERIFKLIHLGLLVLFTLLVSFIVLQQPEHIWEMLLGSGLFLGLTGFRHLILADRGPSIWQGVLPVMEALVLYGMSRYGGAFGLSLFALIFYDVAMDYRASYALVFGAAGYMTYMSHYITPFSQLPLGHIINLLAIGLFQFGIFIGFAFLARSYNHQSKKLKQLTGELHSKMISMEEMTLLRERNRISVEIHNTVGHQLTTALVQIEALRMLGNPPAEELEHRLQLVKDQVRQGLQEIRKAIEAINADSEYQDFAESVQQLIHRVKEHAKIQVDWDLDPIEETRLSTRRVLYHALMESITNAIRHGQCTQVRIRLRKNQGMVDLSVSNNGSLPQETRFGYGLSKMREDLEAIGGALSLRVNENQWFEVRIQVPIYTRGRDEDESDTHHVGG